VGLTKAGEQEGSAAGGKTKFDKTDVPASRQGSFVGEKDSNAGFKASVAGPAFIHEGGLTSIGTEFFNTDPAGPGAVIVNYAKEEVVIYNHEQAKKLGALPFNTGMDAVALGSFNPLTTGHAYTADVGVAYGGNHLESPFVISTGVNATLISEQVASALSIACSIGTFSFTTAAGTFDTPSAVVALDVFPQLGSQSMEVGCLSSALNPDNINVLGTDFLGRFSAVQLNAATGVFSAPEPSLLALGALGVLFIRSRRTRRHRVISEPWADTTDSHRKASSGRAPDAGASG
jgi:hypothetical protein